MIVKRKPITLRSLRSIISIHLLIYSLPLVIFTLQYLFTSTRIIDVPGLSCDVDFSPWFIQLMNILFLVILPTCINVPVVFLVIQHVRFSQNTVRSVHRIHQRLTIQFIILYTMWLVFFIPEVIFMLPIATPESQSWITKVLNTIATLFDAVVITSFDRHFINAWKESLHRILVFIKPANGGIHPIQNTQLVPIRLENN